MAVELLPPEIWLKIFSYLDIDNDHKPSSYHRYLEPLSLVSKQFLSLTSSIPTTLCLHNPYPSPQFLPSLFLRFKNLNSIHLSSFQGDPSPILLQIPIYYPNLHSLKLPRLQPIPFDAFREIGSGSGSQNLNLKVLHLSNGAVIEDKDCVFIADCFPNLEELDISYRFPGRPRRYPPRKSLFTDSGVLALSVKLKNLKRIDISGNHSVTDRGVIALSTNCVFLKKLGIDYCCLVTPNTVGSILRNRPELDELLFRKRGIDARQDPSIDRMAISLSFELARCLSSLDLSMHFVPNEWLFSIGKAQFRLKSLDLSDSYGFSMEGLVSVLSEHRGIERLVLRGVDFLTDYDVSMLSGLLSKLVFVDISCCIKLSVMAFYYLTRACPLLQTLKVGNINWKAEEEGEDPSSMMMRFALNNNSQVRSLYLDCGSKLTNRYLEKILRHCPNLQFLSVRKRDALSEEAVELVMKICPKITHLEIEGWIQIKNLEIDSDVPSLEVLRARKVRFDGNALAVIGKRCRNLRHLDLEGCVNVSADGVKEVVANCKGLREINLKQCKQLDVDIVSWMVLARPSLKKIIPPCGFIPSENERNFYLRHGCLVCDGHNLEDDVRPKRKGPEVLARLI